MKLLLDTHTFLWWMTSSSQLSQAAFDTLSNRRSHVFVSAATAWEMATKYRLGKLPQAGPLLPRFAPDAILEGFTLLPITVHHGLRAGLLEGTHKDPFDRMLIAQALEEDLTIISNEAAFDFFSVKRLW